jgi:hypothetical protein
MYPYSAQTSATYPAHQTDAWTTIGYLHTVTADDNTTMQLTARPLYPVPQSRMNMSYPYMSDTWQYKVALNKDGLIQERILENINYELKENDVIQPILGWEGYGTWQVRLTRSVNIPF